MSQFKPSIFLCLIFLLQLLSELIYKGFEHLTSVRGKIHEKVKWLSKDFHQHALLRKEVL